MNPRKQIPRIRGALVLLTNRVDGHDRVVAHFERMERQRSEGRRRLAAWAVWITVGLLMWTGIIAAVKVVITMPRWN